MFNAAVTFLVLALVAGALGFSGLAGTASSIVQALSLAFLALFLIGFLAGRRGASTRADATGDFALLVGEQAASSADDRVRMKMTSVREAFRLRRMARGQCLLYGFYDEHNLLAEAREARLETLHLLRLARSCWRRALGLAP